MWIESISALADDLTFAPPATEQDLRTCEEALAHPLPEQLRQLLAETNGILGEYELGLVWPVERIQADNLTFRTYPDFAELYMPFDPLTFFADAGNGDQFAFVNRQRRPDVFAWDHETDSRTWVAADLHSYLRQWLDGTIKL